MGTPNIVHSQSLLYAAIFSLDLYGYITFTRNVYVCIFFDLCCPVL